MAVKTAVQPQQLNVKLDWTLVAGAKRLAAKNGVPVNTYIGNLIRADMVAEAETLLAQLDEEQAEVERESRAFREALKEAEQETVYQPKR